MGLVETVRVELLLEVHNGDGRGRLGVPPETWPLSFQLYSPTVKAGAWQWLTTARLFERICSPDRLADLSELTLREFRGGLLRAGIDEENVRWHLVRLRRALKWGFDQNFIDADRFFVTKCEPSGYRWLPPNQLRCRQTLSDFLAGLAKRAIDV